MDDGDLYTVVNDYLHWRARQQQRRNRH